MITVNPQHFGLWVRDNRRAKRLTQEELADKAGITRSQIIRIEAGDSGTTRETASSIAQALALKESEALWLAGFSGEPLPVENMRLAQQIESYLMRVRPDMREAAARILVGHARELSEIMPVT